MLQTNCQGSNPKSAIYSKCVGFIIINTILQRETITTKEKGNHPKDDPTRVPREGLMGAEELCPTELALRPASLTY